MKSNRQEYQLQVQNIANKLAKISPSPPPHHPDHRILIIGRNISNAENGSGGEIPGPAIMNNWQPTSVSPPTPSSSSSSSSSILTQSSPPFYHHDRDLGNWQKASLSCRHYSLATSSESWKLEASSSVVTIGVAASEVSQPHQKSGNTGKQHQHQTDLCSGQISQGAPLLCIQEKIWKICVSERYLLHFVILLGLLHQSLQ